MPDLSGIVPPVQVEPLPLSDRMAQQLTPRKGFTRRSDSASTALLSPPPTSVASTASSPARIDKRGSRARRRMLTIDTNLAEATYGGNGSNGSSSGRRERNAGAGAEEGNPPVIDTTSVEVQHKADGSVAKVNEYIIVGDLGKGSSAEVKLCRLVMPPQAPYRGDRRSSSSLHQGGEASPAEGQGTQSGGEDVEGGGGRWRPQRRGISAGTCEEGQGRGRGRGDSDWNGGVEEGEDGDGDLYAVKVFDRAQLMRRGLQFARPRARGPDGSLLPVPAVSDKYIKVQREIAIMKKLVHPNIVQLVEVIDAPLDRSLYMVMEYVERGAVMRCVEPARGRYECSMRGGCLDGPTAARYFEDILAGLEYLHLHLIAHRDLKPENVLVGDDGRAKIADFGVSQHFMDDEPRTPKSARSLARSDSRAQMFNTEGTWCFWAPEMCGARGDGVAFNAYAADAWAAGVTLWCFLYGTPPFFSLDPMDLFLSIAEDPAPIPLGADTALRDLFERLLAKDARERLTVPEARDHGWVRSWLADMRRDDDGGGVSHGSGGGGGGTVVAMGGALLAQGSFSSCSSSAPPTPAEEDRGSRLGAAAAGDNVAGGGDGGGSEGEVADGVVGVSTIASATGDSVVSVVGGDGGDGGDGGSGGRRRSGGGGDDDRGGGGGGDEYAGAIDQFSPYRDHHVDPELRDLSVRWPASGPERVAVTDEDVRAAVTHAPGFVVVARLKDTMHGMKLKARRLSSELGAGAATRVAVFREASKRSGSRRYMFSSNNGGESGGGGESGYITAAPLFGGGPMSQEDSEEKHVEHPRRQRTSSIACAIS